MLEDFLMVKKPTYEELKQRVFDLEKEIKKREGVSARKDTTLHRRTEEFINKYPSAIKKIPAKEIQYLVEDLQVHKTELEVQNEKLRQAQLELETSRDRYSDLYDFAPVSYFTINDKGMIQEVNLTGTTMLGVERRFIIGKPFSKFITRDTQGVFCQYRKELLDTKAPQSFEIRLRNKNGSEFWVQLQCVLVQDAAGKFNRIRAAMSNIDNRKQAEEALREAHDMLEMRVEERTVELSKANEVLGVEIAERKQVEAVLQENERELTIRNRIVEIFLTIPDEEMYGEVLQIVLETMESPYGTFAYIDENGDRIVPSMTRDIWDECKMTDKGIFFPRDKWSDTLWARCLIEKKSFSSNGPFKVPDGHMPVGRALATPIIYQGESIGNLMVGDKPTDYGETDKELLETIADHIAPVLHARLVNERNEKERKQVEEALRKQTHNLDERVKELNCLYGISKLIEAPDISFEEVLQGVVNLIPPSWQYPEITCARMIIEDQVFVTDNFKETIWKQTSNIILDAKQIGLLEVFHLEEKQEMGEGSFLKEESHLINAIAERMGKIIGHIRTEDALKDAQEELMVKDKLATIGKLSGNIAHEIRNPLGVIGSSAYYIKRNLEGKNKKLGEHLERIQRQVTKATAVIESMLNLTRIRESELHKVDLKAMISEVITAANIPKTITKIQHFPPEDVFVKADLEQLTMSFNNIVTNAIDAMDRVGTLTVTVQRTSNDRAELSFADTGSGIDPKNLDKVFQPLFSTKTKGIGFGLSIVKKAIENHDGTIELVSELEKGTTIIIRLPLDTDTNKEN